MHRGQRNDPSGPEVGDEQAVFLGRKIPESRSDVAHRGIGSLVIAVVRADIDNALARAHSAGDEAGQPGFPIAVEEHVGREAVVARGDVELVAADDPAQRFAAAQRQGARHDAAPVLEGRAPELRDVGEAEDASARGHCRLRKRSREILDPIALGAMWKFGAATSPELRVSG